MRRSIPSSLADRAPVLGIALVVAALLGVVVLHRAPPPPLWWLTRDRLPECAAISVALGEVGPTTSSCLSGDDAARTGAELVVTTLTTEGAPVRTHYRRLPGEQGLEVVTDASDDALAGITWDRRSCPQATSLHDLGACAPAP